jgi:hypothetical protein
MKKKKNLIKKIFVIKISFILRSWIKNRMRDSALKNNIRAKIISEKKEKPFLVTFYTLKCSARGEEENLKNFFNEMYFFIEYMLDE